MTARASLNTLLALGLMALSLGADSAPPAEAPHSAQPGFVSIFDGKTLDGWKGLTDFWSVEDGSITGKEDKEHAAPQTFLIFEKPLANFELHYKYRFVTPTGNSGVQFRSKIYNPETFSVGGYQADCDANRGYDGTIYDEHGIAGGRGTMSKRGEKTHWTDAKKPEVTPLAESAKELKEALKPTNEWNDVVLIADGNHVKYSINGHLMTELIDDNPKALKEGVVALQLHKGFVMKVQYKDIELKVLEEGK
jgi:hypothetical protein